MLRGVNYAMLAKIVLIAVLVAGFIAVAWCLTQSFEACATGQFSEGQKLGLGLSADIVKFLLTLSTALVAVGGTIVLELKEVPKLNDVSNRVLVLASTCCFAFSAYFALLWQSRLAARVYFQSCPSLVTQSWMEAPFIAHTYSFLFGIALTGFLVLLATFGEQRQ
jgi:hypothetical protein